MRTQAKTIEQRDKNTAHLAMCISLLARYGIMADARMVTSKSRDSEHVFHRACVCYILRKKKFSFAQIGAIINRDHSTVINLIRYDQPAELRYESNRKTTKTGPFDLYKEQFCEFRDKFVFYQTREELRIIIAHHKERIRYHENELKKAECAYNK